LVEYGFFFDQNRCIDCRACVIACRDWNDIAAGPVKWCRMFEWEKGTFPNIRLNFLFAPCYHCQDPVCVNAANGAMYKEEKYGAVLIDPDKATSIDLRKANEACPYGAIAFESDAMNAKASKCTMCIDRLEQGLKPICVEVCPMRALNFGPLEDMIKKYGSNRDLEDMPSSNIAKPAIVFKPREAKKQLVPYDTDKAISLLGRRDALASLPPYYTTKAQATETYPGLVGRDKLIMKPANVAEAMKTTQHDES
jgi:anaerobic dimethyl sulfoxide reductase subunit B (iron-sulfur subunit)